MAEYIDRDKLNKKKKYLLQTQEMPFPKSEYFIKVDDFWNMPTADVIERAKIDRAIADSYKKGLTDAWECARKIGNNSQLGLEEMGFDFSELGTYYNPSWWVVFNYDVFKALEILKRNIDE